MKQIIKKLERIPMKKYVKPIDITSFLQAKLHEDITVLGDKMAQMGLMTTDERIALSSAVGDMLKAFRDSIQSNVPSLSTKMLDKDDLSQFMYINQVR